MIGLTRLNLALKTGPQQFFRNQSETIPTDNILAILLTLKLYVLSLTCQVKIIYTQPN